MDKKGGFSLVEIMFSMFILVLLVTAVTAVYIMAYRMQAEARAQSRLFQQACGIMERIQRGESGMFGLMKGRSDSVVIAGTGDRIDFMADKNTYYTQSTADDTQMSIYFDNGDGDNATFQDNTAVLDPGGGASLIELGSNVQSLQFSQSGNIVTVQLTLMEEIRGRPFRLELSRNILMRN